jgi:methyl-accepting chemotaxis protein
VAKERINVLLAGIRMQHTRFGDVLGETARASAEVADTIDELITGIQFQDRTKQQVAQVVDTLDVLRDGIIVAQQDTDAAFPGLFQPGDLDQAALERIVAKQTLGAMKARILARLLGPDSDASGVPEDQPEAETGAGEVELF